MLSFLFLLLLAHTSPLESDQNLSQNRINIFILAGQSNMAGRGGVLNDIVTHNLTWDGIVPPQCQPNPSILRLSGDLVWVEAKEPLHADIDVTKTNGVGPGMPFANAVLTRNTGFGVVGLIPCAIGGTDISEWEKGRFLYEQLVRRSQFALQSGGVYRAVLWYQGESDTVTKEDADLYKGRLVRFFTDLRADLQAPTLPIFQVGLASGLGPYVDIVREAQIRTDLVNVQCVDAKGLPLEPDGLHLTTPVQVRHGKMLPDSFLKSLPTPIRTTSNAPTKFSNCISYLLIPSFLRSLWKILTTLHQSEFICQ